MKRVLSLVIVLMLAITMFSGITASAAAIEATLTPNFIDKHAVYRYFGATRIETALEVAKEHWYDPYDSQCNDERNSPPNALILAYAKNFPDALVGGTISAAVDAPIILTNNAGGLEANVRDYIKRCVFDKCHGTRAIYILGGTDVISAAIEQDVKNLLMHAYGIPVTFDQLISGSSRTTSWNVNNITDGYYLKRLAGDDRYGTATAVATELNKINVFNLGVPNAQAIQTILANFKLPEVFLTNGNDFPDALAITPVAGSMKVDLGHGVKVPYVAPILFTQGANATVNATTAAYLADRKVKEVVLIGGYTVLNSGIETDLSKKGISNTSRVYGETRYETSLRIYEKYRTGYTVFSGSNDVVLATARDFPDALVGGALACKLGNYCKGGVPILMIDGTGEVKNDIKNTIHSTLSLAGPATAYVMGGSV
ncbi:MAG: cell wall-binding repeat-containing protein, partial [Oscillospiraceae bacterium]|nr:cell wall-binding repeat-containing protein [Oscillospiraceae bacterium]